MRKVEASGATAAVRSGQAADWQHGDSDSRDGFGILEHSCDRLGKRKTPPPASAGEARAHTCAARLQIRRSRRLAWLCLTSRAPCCRKRNERKSPASAPASAEAPRDLRGCSGASPLHPQAHSRGERSRGVLQRCLHPLSSAAFHVHSALTLTPIRYGKLYFG